MKIQELTQKIYQDGVEKARQEEKTILEDARKEAETILSQSRQEASRIIEEAEKAAGEAKSRLDAEISLAAQQGLSLLRQRVSDLLVGSSLSSVVREAMEDKEFIESLIRSVVEKWDTGQTSIDLSLILPEADQKRFEEFFAGKAKDLLDRGLAVTFTGRMKNGFEVAPKDGSYKLSFDETDFVEFFKSFLKQRTKELLFPGRNS